MTEWRVDTFFSKEPETLDWIDKFNILKVDQENKNQLKNHIKKLYKLKNSKKKYNQK